MRRVTGFLVVFLVFAASAQGEVRWNRQLSGAQNIWVTFGTVADNPVSATPEVTSPLLIPEFCEYVAITVRGGVVSPVIGDVTSASVAGKIDSASAYVGFFPSQEDAAYYVEHHAFLGNPPPVYTATAGSTPALVNTELPHNYGTYVFPVFGKRYLVLRMTPVSGRETWINEHGITFQIKFQRFR